MKTNPLVEVSEASREAARMPVEMRLQKLEAEREELIQKKRDVELQLSEIEAWKRSETAKILSRRLDKSRSIEQVTLLQSRVYEKKNPVMREKQAIEKRLHDLKGRLHNMRQHQKTPDNRHNEYFECLLRIENLLIRVVEQMES